MNNLVFGAQVALDLAIAGWLVVLGLLRKKPSLVSLFGFGLVEVGLLVQTVTSVVMVAAGERAKTDTVEFFAYVFVALIVPIGAGFWAMIERTRWSVFVLALASLTVVIMLFRMQQIWVG
ncbi:MAG: hypothetical protein ACKOWJ_00375 [Micrococcales bacterium]